MRIYGSLPRMFSAGTDALPAIPCRRVGEECTVPEGLELVVPQHGEGAYGGHVKRLRFPAGTRFVVRYPGSVHQVACTEITHDARKA